jgi:cytochrome c oxidase subunit 2
MFDNFPIWPVAASSHAFWEDALYLFLVAVCAAMTLLIFAAVAVLATKYRRRHGREATPIHGSLLLEITWSVLPMGVFLLMFVGGAVLFFKMRTPPRDAADVYVVAKQRMWKLQHTEGQREINELHVPVGRDTKLIMTSQDVIHSFYVPAFRVKMDVIPGRYTTMWFRPTRAGTYHLFCAQYCGTMHSGMIGQVVVMEPADYQAWMSGGPVAGSLAENGQALFQQLGCSTCHRFDVQGRGPNLTGIFGKPVQLQDGRTVTADEDYIRESILNSQAKIVSGFQPIMPVFQGQISEEQLNALVAYVKSLSQAPSGAASAQATTPATTNQVAK